MVRAGRGTVRGYFLRMTETWPGTAYPLGATFDGSGTNFALFSEVAERVELCLFDPDPDNAGRVHRDAGSRSPRSTPTSGTATSRPCSPASATATASTARGTPTNGQRCNPNKLLLDPYAKATAGEIDWDQSLFAYNFGDEDRRNDDDSAAHMTHGVVINPFFDWEGDRRLAIPYNESFIYEAHVKGLTQLHPDVPEEQRGTYAGLAHPSVTAHLQKLGVTAIELMPVHQFVQDSTLLDQGLRNYWGYNTLGFFAPHADYAASQPGPAGPGVQGDGQGDARRRHRGHPRRRLQPHRRGQPPRPDAELQGHRQRGLLPPRRGRPALLHGLHRHRQHPQRAPPALGAADHGLAALLGHRDARRRLPLRPRRDAWRASSTTSTSSPPSSRWCSRTRWSAR